MNIELDGAGVEVVGVNGLVVAVKAFVAPSRAPAFISGLLSPKEGLGTGPDVAEVGVKTFAASVTPELTVVLVASGTDTGAVAEAGAAAGDVCPNVNTLGGSAAFTSEALDPPWNIGGFIASMVLGTLGVCVLPNAEKPVVLLSPMVIGALLNAELVLRFPKPAKEDLPLSAGAPALLKPVETG